MAVPDPEFTGVMSSDEIWYAGETNIRLTDVIDEKADITHTHSGYATTDHTHSNYASQSDLELLEDVVDTKANVSHTHSSYALTSHSHDEYASVSHTHTASEVGASPSGHNHDDIYAPISHSHSNYATTTALNELSTTVSGKANVSHSHDDVYYTETEVDTKLATKADSSHTHTGVYDASGAAASALTSANAYTDSKINALVGEGASTTLDTIGEISSAIEDNQDAIDLLNSAIANKANASDLTSHTGNTTIHTTSTEKTNWNAAKTHADSAHAPVNAEENQNAFSNVAVGSTTISADSKTDTLTLVAGSNVTLTPDTTGDSITIAATNTVYTHPTSAGNKHIPAGGSSGQILRWSADGTAVWGNDNNTTYSNATQTSSGLMSSTDKTKLDGIAEGANNYTLPSAGSSLGGVMSGGDVTISSGVITVNDDSHNHVISNVDGLQSALDGKAASSHTHDDTYYTETEIDTLLSSKANTSHTHTIANITNLQSTLDGKASASHGTHVTYSTTAPVMDGTASVGTASTVARSDHKHPTDTSRASQTSLDSHVSNVSNPHNVTLSQLGITATASELNALDGITATVTELNYVDGVTSNIQTQLNNKASSSHTHSVATTSASGLMSASDKEKLDGIASGANAYVHPTYTARTGVPTANATLTHGGTFTVTQPICDATGHITAMNTRTYTLPSDNNTDTKVTNTLATTTKAYVTGTTSSTTNTGTQVFDTGVYLDTVAGKLTATTFNGTTFSGSGVATVSEVETYLNI